MDRKQLILDWMGKPAHVIVDRPIGYRHGDLLYPVNYGYLPGVMAGDGEEQDVYILGVSEPLETFDGQVIGAIRRENDTEDKLVAAPFGTRLHQAQIMEAVYFQERFFQSTVDSLLRRSCGVIPYRLREGTREYLVLMQTNGSWSFPKGHMEPGETEIQTALRELHEETGLDAQLLPGMSVTLEYAIAPFTTKQVVLFLGEVSGTLALQEKEILGHRWAKAEELANYLHADTFRAVQKLLD